MNCFRVASSLLLGLAMLSSFGQNHPLGTANTLTLTLSPAAVAGGADATGTITLGSPAPSGGAFVQINSANVAATVPASVKIASGPTTSTFTIKTSSVQSQTSATILATQGASNSSATLTINPIGILSLSLNPTTCTGGGTSAGTVTLNGPAPIGGATVTLSSSSSTAAVPASLLIPKGQTSGNFEVDTSPVSASTAITITGAVGSTAATASLVVNPASLLSISLTPATISGGLPVSGTINLTAAAPAGGLAISLTSSSTSASTATTIKVAEGKSSTTFNVKTAPVIAPTPVTISATLGSALQTASFTIEPPALATVTISPSSVHGGANATGTVTLTGPAHAGGIIIELASGQSAGTVPATVTIAQNNSRATFVIKTTPVLVDTPISVTATANGVTKTADLKVEAPVLHAFTLSPTNVIGGAAVTGTVTLDSPAPDGGMTIFVSSKSTAASIPVSVTVPAGMTSATFEITTGGVSSGQEATVLAKLGTVTKSASLTIKASTISTFTLNPASVAGGSPTTGTLTLDGPAPTSGALVRLSTSAKASDPPSTVLIPAGQTSITFTITTATVKTQTTVHITASLDGASKSVNLTITK